MSSKHTLRADCPFGHDSIAVVIRYAYTKGAPEQGPSYASGGQPADPDEIELESVHVQDSGVVLTPHLQERLNEWAIEYLASDEGFGAACDWAVSSLDDARERSIEMRRYVMFGGRDGF